MSKDNKNISILNAIASMAQHPMFIYEQGVQNLLLKYNSFVEHISVSDEVAKQAIEKNKKDCQVQFFNASNEIYYGSFAADFQGKIKENSIAVVPVMGAMMRDDYCDMALNFVAGTRSLERTISQLDTNSNVNGIVLHVSTPGGQSMGNESLANVIKNTNTPIVVYFEMMASAGVYAFAGADEIWGAESEAIWGSIGTYITLVDNTKMLESLGYDIKEIYATESTEKNIEFRAALDGNEEPMIEWLDKSNKAFIQHVKKVRPSIKDDGHVSKGKIYSAKEAKKIGAIDGIGSMDHAINRARILGKKKKSSNKSNNNNSSKNILAMSDENQDLTFFEKLFGKKTEAQVTDDLKALKQDLDQSKENAAKFSQQLEVSNAKLEELSAENKTLLEEKAALSTNVEELQAKVQELEAANKTQKEENEKLIAHNKELGGMKSAETPTEKAQDNGNRHAEAQKEQLSPFEMNAQILRQIEERQKENS